MNLQQQQQQQQQQQGNVNKFNINKRINQRIYYMEKCGQPRESETTNEQLKMHIYFQFESDLDVVVLINNIRKQINTDIVK